MMVGRLGRWVSRLSVLLAYPASRFLGLPPVTPEMGLVGCVAASPGVRRCCGAKALEDHLVTTLDFTRR